MYKRAGHHAPHRPKDRILKAFLPAILIVLGLFVTVHLTRSSPLSSPEVAFTDASAHGLSIVPASCPSVPTNPDYPHNTCTPEVPTGAAASCTATGAGTASVKLSWVGGPDDTSYLLRIDDPTHDGCSIPPYNAAWYCAAPSELIKDNQTTSSYSESVTPGITYSWWVQGANAFGSTPTADTSTFLCPVTPTNTSAHCNTDGTVTLAWSSQAGDSQTTIRVDDTATALSPDYSNTAATSPTTIPVTNGDTYSWSVQGSNTYGTSDSAKSSFTCTSGTLQCPFPKVVNASGNSCVCPAGQRTNPITGQCTSSVFCPDGSFAPGGNMSLCPATVYCSDGSVAPNGDASQCSPATVYCPDGSVAPGGDLTQCPTIARCADGTIAPDNDVNECDLAHCADGTVPPGGDLTQCNPIRCGDGTYAPFGDETRCGSIPRCPDGTIAPQGNVSLCGSTACATGYQRNSSGNCVFVQCPQGYTQVGNACEFTGCPVGYTTNPDNSCSFTSCPAGYQPQTTSSGSVCVKSSCSAPFFYCGTGATTGTQFERTYGTAPSCVAQDILISNCGANGCNTSTGICYSSASASISLNARPQLVRTGDRSVVSMQAIAVTSCSLHGPAGSTDTWPCNGTDCANQSHQTLPITVQTVYTADCIAAGVPLTQSVTIDVVPIFKEQ